jgi:hypothetical protein
VELVVVEMVQQDQLVQLAPLGHLVLREQAGLQEHRVLREQADPREHPELTALQELLV